MELCDMLKQLLLVSKLFRKKMINLWSNTTY